MKNCRLVCVLLMLLPFFGAAQSNDSLVIGNLAKVSANQMKVDKDGNRYYRDDQLGAEIIDDGDGERIIVLDEMHLGNQRRFNNDLDRKYYSFLNKKLRNAYPLFLTALQQYNKLEDDISKMSKREKKKYVKERQSELADQYEKQLRNLTTTEGRVFAKLMDRATGKTPYDLIKDLRGGWSSFWWNVKGKAADIDLKEGYDPYHSREDAFIEALLRYNWKYGFLQPYPGSGDYQLKRPQR